MDITKNTSKWYLRYCKKRSRTASILSQSKEYFNEHAATYNFYEPALCYQPVFDIIKKRTGNIKLLDIGCGNGIMMKKIADELDNIEKITGVDISIRMVEEAKKRLAMHRCCVLEGTMETVNLRHNFYNVILCMHSFHHYPHPLRTLKKINRIMDKKGIFILADNRKEGWDRWIRNWTLFKQGYPDGDMWVYSKMELLILGKLAGFKMDKYQSAGENSFIMVFSKS